MSVGTAGGFFYLLFGGGGVAVEDVIVDSVVEEEGVLIHDADVITEGGLLNAFDIMPINEDAAFFGIVEAHEEGEEGGLPCSTWTDEGVAFPRFDSEIDALDGGDAFLVVEGEVFEGDLALDVFERWGVLCVSDVEILVHEFEDFAGSGEAFLKEDVDAAERFKRRVEHDEAAIERDKIAGGEVVFPDVNEGCGDADGGDGFDGGADGFEGFAPAHDEAHHFVVGTGEAFDFVVFTAVGFHDAEAGEGFLHDYHKHPRFFFLFASSFADFFADGDDRQDTKGEDEEGEDGEFPIDVEEDGEGGEDGEGLLHGVGGDGGERHLRHARLVKDGLDHVARFAFPEKIQ